MNVIALIFFVAGLLFIGYAVFTQYKGTAPTDSVPHRVWASVVAAAASIGAAAWAWAHNAIG